MSAADSVCAQFVALVSAALMAQLVRPQRYDSTSYQELCAYRESGLRE